MNKEDFKAQIKPGDTVVVKLKVVNCDDAAGSTQTWCVDTAGNVCVELYNGDLSPIDAWVGFDSIIALISLRETVFNLDE